MRLIDSRSVLQILITMNGLFAASFSCPLARSASRSTTAAAAAAFSSAANRSSPSFVPSRRRSRLVPHPIRGDRRGGVSPLYFFSTLLGRDEPNKEKEEEEERQLLLDPKAPLRPLLSENSHENHLSQYTLPPTAIGVDDYRPNLRKGQRVVTFGDVHGDIAALRSFLVLAGVLDPPSADTDDPLWCGGDAICVQTGDVLDRGDDELACFRLLASLARQARGAGGALLLLYGNHEALNAGGLFQYANAGGNVEFERTIGDRIDYNYGSNRWRLQFAGNEPSRWASFEPGGLLAENLLGNMLVTCVVGRTVFVHAGLVASHLRDGNVEKENGEKLYGGISKLNRQAREWILNAHHGDNNNWGEYNSVEEVIATAQNRAKVASKTMPDCLGGGIGASSPVWMRDYSQPNDKEPKNPKAKAMIEEAFRECGPDVRRMVMGHTPQQEINSALGGRAWRIDVGASQGVLGGTPEALEIIHMGGEDDEDVVSVLTTDGRRVDARERSVTHTVVTDFFDLRR